MDITPSQAVDALIDIVQAKLVPMLHGSPGVGKSDIYKQVADHFNLELIDFRLSQVDPVLLMGFPSIIEEDSKSTFIPLKNFPLEGDAIPEGKDGWFILFDEINTAPNSVQAAAYKILLDKMVGDKPLHSNVAMGAAGNLTTDGAITNRMSTALQSRLIHLTLQVSTKDWLTWANKAEIDYRITSFIKFEPNLLHKFDSKHTDNTFPCPRTWNFLSALCKNWKEIPNSKLPVIAGTIGEGPAVEFKAFTDIMESLPTFTQMCENPSTLRIPDDPSTIYAMIGLIGHNINETNIEVLMKLIKRFPIEFQVICLQDLVHKPKLIDTPAMESWLEINAAQLSAYA